MTRTRGTTFPPALPDIEEECERECDCGCCGIGRRGNHMRRHVTIDIPAPSFPPVKDRKTGRLKQAGPFINSNQRYHRHQEAKMTKAWRETAALRAAGIPTFTSKVHITAHIFKPRAGRFDPNNLAGTSKACVDGLVDAGLLVDDSLEYVIGPDHRYGGKGNPEIVLEIIEIGELE